MLFSPDNFVFPKSLYLATFVSEFNLKHFLSST